MASSSGPSDSLSGPGGDDDGAGVVDCDLTGLSFNLARKRRDVVKRDAGSKGGQREDDCHWERRSCCVVARWTPFSARNPNAPRQERHDSRSTEKQTEARALLANGAIMNDRRHQER
jgi:hypothetical protein